MSRAGRKRLHQLKRKGIAIVSTAETVPTPNQVARRMPHRRLAAADFADHEGFETPLGTLWVLGAIPPHLYAAGIRYGRAIREYRGAIEAPRAAGSIAGVGQPSRARSDRDPKLLKEAEMEIWPIVMALRSAGKRAEGVTQSVIVEEAGIPPGGFRALLEGLGALAEHFKQQQRAP